MLALAGEVHSKAARDPAAVGEAAIGRLRAAEAVLVLLRAVEAVLVLLLPPAVRAPRDPALDLLMRVLRRHTRQNGSFAKKAVNDRRIL
jgi:hypothetical protein